jgi:heptosyltransferase-2
LTFAARVPNWLGDAVLAAPAVRGLVESSRRSRVLVLASTSSAEIYSRMAGTLVFPIKTPGADVVRWITAIHDGSGLLRRFAPVVVFSMTKSFTSAATCLAGRVPRRVGLANGLWRFFYTDRIALADSKREHMTETYCRIVESVGIRVGDRVPAIAPSKSDLDAGVGAIGRHGLKAGRFVCLFPGARYGPAKRWDASRFGLLGDAIVANLGLKIVILGDGRDNPVSKAVEAEMAGGSVNLCGQVDFSTLVGILGLSGGVVANDSGGMHLAAALGLPVVGLFFSTDPGWTGPVSPRAEALYNRIDCSPCFRRSCSRGYACTKAISVDQAMAALARVRGKVP